MRGQRMVFVVVASAVAGSVGLAQPGRGGSQWLTSLADAQRTSWVRTDEKISVGTLSKPGFEQQWKAKLDNQPRGPHGLGQGVTASGVTLFVPISLVTGSSNNVYAIDNDTGYVVWQRHFDASLPASTPGCPGGITAGATRIVSLGPSATAPGAALSFGGRGAVGYRSLLGEPGEGVPVEGPAAGRGRAGGDPSPESRRPEQRRAARRVLRLLPHLRQRVARVKPAIAFQERRDGKRAGRLPCSFGHPVSVTSSRATACCTCSAWRRARISSAPRHSCLPTPDGPRPLRLTRRSMPRHQETVAARPVRYGLSILTARRSLSCRGRPTVET